MQYLQGSKKLFNWINFIIIKQHEHLYFWNIACVCISCSVPLNWYHGLLNNWPKYPNLYCNFVFTIETRLHSLLNHPHKWSSKMLHSPMSTFSTCQCGTPMDVLTGHADVPRVIGCQVWIYREYWIMQMQL